MLRLTRQRIKVCFSGYFVIVFCLSAGLAQAEDSWHFSVNAEHGYTDNLFYTSEDELSDYWLSISPEIWYTLPGTPEKTLYFETDPLNPSGTSLFSPQPSKIQGASAYARYVPTFDIYGDNDSENATDHLIEGMLQFGFIDGPQLSLIDRYQDTRESWYRGTDHRAKEYQANLFQAKTHIVDNATSQLRFDFTHYSTRFDDDIDTFRNRSDNRFDIFVGAKVEPEKMIYAEYILIRTDYEKNVVSNNEDRRGAVGVDWNNFFNTSGRLNLGFQMKLFDNDHSMKSIFFWEIQVITDISDRHQLRIFTDQGLLETDVRGTQYIESATLELGYRWQFKPRLALELSGNYIRDDYGDNRISLDGQSRRLKRNRTSLGTKVIWQLTDDIEVTGGYQYETGNSNFQSLDYSTNRLVVSARKHF